MSILSKVEAQSLIAKEKHDAVTKKVARVAGVTKFKRIMKSRLSVSKQLIITPPPETRDRSVSVDKRPLTPKTPTSLSIEEIGRAVQQECRDRSRMPSSA
eukprot:TRINITY_DN9811_c0_g1_i5.p1 TRINITY_DN9811_c0_g1~~TRINITY_DN9811_c0_g1_i5.p1  ORF type:complete len:100 (+),score=11.90 TRINITY_DN9811_c0_g1_i5:139-438(+)